MPLTERQQEIFQFILHYRRENGCSPSIPEIQREFGIRSPNGVAGHLSALETKGYIRRSERGSRSVDVLRGDSTAATFTLPVFGAIPAGPPTEYMANESEGSVSLDEAALGFRPKPGAFVLKVRGDSMRDAGIFHGDWVVVEPAPRPRTGAIVAALIDGQSTLKRLVEVGNGYYLKAENPDYPELHPQTDLAIQGVVRTVIRRLQ